MEKNILEKIRLTQQMLEGVVKKVNELTSGNVSHNVASIRSVTSNINDVMIDPLIEQCAQDDFELKLLLEKIERNIRAVDGLLQDITPTTVDNGKKHLSAWIQFYADALNEALLKYDI